MRPVAVLVVVAACGFEHGALTTSMTSKDASPDVPADTRPTWAIDGQSHKALPANSMEWQQFIAGTGVSVGVPNHAWLMDAQSGSLDDVIDGVALNPVNLPTYDNAVTGWTRTAVGTYNAAGDRGFLSTSIGNLDATPHLLLVYVQLASIPTTDRSLIGIGSGTDHRFVVATPGGVIRVTQSSGASVIGTASLGTEAHPLAMKIDPSSSSYTVYTDNEKVSGTWNTPSGKGPLVVLGSATVGTADARYLYGVLWTGASAQLDDADAKKLLQSLGWTVTGY